MVMPGPGLFACFLLFYSITRARCMVGWLLAGTP